MIFFDTRYMFGVLLHVLGLLNMHIYMCIYFGELLHVLHTSYIYLYVHMFYALLHVAYVYVHLYVYLFHTSSSSSCARPAADFPRSSPSPAKSGSCSALRFGLNLSASPFFFTYMCEYVCECCCVCLSDLSLRPAVAAR